MKKSAELKQEKVCHRAQPTLTVLCILLLWPSVNALSQSNRERQYGSYKTDVARGVKIGVGNRTTGRITISGWDRNVIEARAFSDRGSEVVIVIHSDVSGVSRLYFKADYADLEHPETPNALVDSVPLRDDRPLKVHLELKVPRYVEIERIQVRSSEVEVSDVETQIEVSGTRSNILLKRVGAADVQNRSGNVEIDGVDGLASVITASGAIKVNKSKSFVHAVSIAGPIDVACSTGRVDVSNAEAPITLTNIDGDLDAIGTNSSVTMTGHLREGARYFLKSMSGRVEVILPDKTRGFTSILSSYRGLIETDFKLNNKQSSPETQGKRVVGQFGNGKTQILLDSFEGLVRLTKVAEAAITTCK